MKIFQTNHFMDRFKERHDPSATRKQALSCLRNAVRGGLLKRKDKEHVICKRIFKPYYKSRGKSTFNILLREYHDRYVAITII